MGDFRSKTALLVCVLGACFQSVFANEKCWELLSDLTEKERLVAEYRTGTAIHRENDHQSLSKESSDDLKVATELGERLASFLITDHGKKHLIWQLNNPSRDPVDIRARQEAVKELINKPELREEIRRLLTKMRGKKGYLARLWERLTTGKVTEFDRTKDTDDAMENLLREIPNDSRYFMNGTSIAAPTLLATSIALNFAAVEPRFIALAAFLHKFSMLPNGLIQFMKRNNLMGPKAMVTAASNLKGPLKKSESNYLRELGDLLSAVDDKGHPLDFASTARDLQKTFSKTQSLFSFIDATGITNWTLHKKNVELERDLGKLAVVSSGLAELELFLAFADMKLAHPELTFPKILDGEKPSISIEGMQHPVHYFRGDAVPNSLSLSVGPTQDGSSQQRFVFLTGPNGRGKSTVMKALALNMLLAQSGASVFAKNMQLTPMELLVSMRSADSNTNQESLYMAEARRLAEIVNRARNAPGTLVLVDEMSTGTTHGESLSVEQALLEALAESNTLGIVASHKRELTGLNGKIPGLVNQHMSDSEDPDRIYRLEPGPSSTTNAFTVLQRQGMPVDIVRRAEQLYKEQFKPKPVEYPAK